MALRKEARGALGVPLGVTEALPLPLRDCEGVLERLAPRVRLGDGDAISV